MNPDQRLMALCSFVAGLAFNFGVFALALMLQRRVGCDLALLSVGATYLCFIAQVWEDGSIILRLAAIGTLILSIAFAIVGFLCVAF